MEYFIIDGFDFSPFVNELSIEKEFNYNAQTNAAGDTVVDLINAKRTIEVGIIPVNGEDLVLIQSFIDNFQVMLSFINPLTGFREENVVCIIPSNNVEYYTIQADKVLTKGIKLKFIEL